MAGSSGVVEPFTVRLPEAVREELKRRAVSLDRPVAWVVRQALSEFLSGGAR